MREARTKEFIEETYDPLGRGNNPIISIVTVGEIRSIAKRNYWGAKRLKAVESIMNKLIITDINYEDLIEMYAEIDAFSQGTIKDKPLGMSARNMGKNDLWIAATAVTEKEKAFEKYAVPESYKVSRQLVLNSYSNIDFKKPHEPILFVGGGSDHIFPPNLTKTIPGRYKDTNSRVDIKIFEGKSHFICGEKGWENVADYILDWYEKL